MGQSLRVADLVVKSRSGRPLLTVPSFAADPGALIGIRGPSGAGKSTLLFAISGLLERVEGSVTWDETEILALPIEQRTAFRAAHMGMIFQDLLLFEELSADQNAGVVSLFGQPSRRGKVNEQGGAHLAALGLSDTARSVVSYSGGERQRVAIARALASDPKILLADEPTASLDRANADRLIDDLTGLVRAVGKTMIVVSHDALLLKRMDRVLTIRDGQIAADEVPA
ncbi:MAG: ATP-binding cassette domain-containing protein [Pseudomonadota bacterium]